MQQNSRFLEGNTRIYSLSFLLERGPESGVRVGRSTICILCFFLSVCVCVCVCVCVEGLHPWHMEVPRLGVKLELQLLVYATGTAMLDLSRVCNLHWSSQQRQIPNPLSKARDGAHILMDARFVSAEPRWKIPHLHTWFVIVTMLCFYYLTIRLKPKHICHRVHMWQRWK